MQFLNQKCSFSVAAMAHDYENNTLRRAKTDKKDAVKLASYGLDRWVTLPRYVPEDNTRLLLKNNLVFC